MYAETPQKTKTPGVLILARCSISPGGVLILGLLILGGVVLHFFVALSFGSISVGCLRLRISF